ncbi:hypothetical protein HFU84_03855 [Acidithiobacillus sp. CV18-2]|uniref:Uncharacterized protein n=1 Tax=Igneacidithiobacillus copahuensis TaxID=2724909 RepID=A0AAE3CKP7_9PROT|nr:hypothetical protein [Acidithiobacillus sp. CV18-2]MBU2789066.1 hypothetical protein [Igneacidithiobacillus copahuensis]
MRVRHLDGGLMVDFRIAPDGHVVYFSSGGLCRSFAQQYEHITRAPKLNELR